jgi:dephospho-CoA kinase
MPKTGRKPVVGLLGGIGSGKSTVARCFQRLRCAVIDADKLAKNALRRPQIKQRIRQWWGPAVLTPSGAVSRPALAQRVFDDVRARRRLESLIHPLVRRQRQQLRSRYRGQKRVKAIIEDVPLLLEAGLARECDVLVFVHAPLQVRQRRVAAARGWSTAELRRREKAQTPLDKKKRVADYVIVNNADVAETLSQTRRVLSQILQLYPRGRASTVGCP